MIDHKALEHIAHLAKLYVSETEAQEFASQLSKALGHFEQISKVDTKGVEPLVTPSEVEAYWRPDEVKKELTAEEIVANAPARTGNLFTVPPVV
ncbi:MAG: Asp-tRNA(Asn)/Glu-tRNA(Gln) amidotransferase subunit GatC [Bdellovibrionaceae bacterium]|nr:Asp-tRNA(Asn)/Glu-tRNA(Gln) amidotransferase subunit GatC [Pseudobdellovibrionaceae bacterium]